MVSIFVFLSILSFPHFPDLPFYMSILLSECLLLYHFLPLFPVCDAWKKGGFLNTIFLEKGPEKSEVKGKYGDAVPTSREKVTHFGRVLVNNGNGAKLQIASDHLK